MTIEIIMKNGDKHTLLNVYSIERISFELQVKQLTLNFLYYSRLFQVDDILKINILNV